jgi:hypothetical protein
MATYTLITGDVFEVEADTPDEAHAKHEAYAGGWPCPCGVKECDCVQFREVATVVEEADWDGR